MLVLTKRLVGKIISKMTYFGVCNDDVML